MDEKKWSLMLDATNQTDPELASKSTLAKAISQACASW